MYIANVLIEQVEISYEGLVTCEEKQQLHERIAYKLSEKHNLKISLVKEKPVFFVTAESKMNNPLTHV